MFRWDNSHQLVRDRLLGTTVSLIGATSNTTCGTIDSVSDVRSVEAQTYTVSCPATTESTQAVFLYDDVPTFENNKWKNVINIAEVMVYELLTQGKLKSVSSDLSRRAKMDRSYLWL